MVTNAIKAGAFSKADRRSHMTISSSISKGISHSRSSPRLARSSPLSDSLLPLQPSCTQGRKKQIKTNIARLKVILLTVRAAFHRGAAGIRLFSFRGTLTGSAKPSSESGDPFRGKHSSKNALPGWAVNLTLALLMQMSDTDNVAGRNGNLVSNVAKLCQSN